jgi:membrane protease YdiL (CAAX protease family)
MEATQELVRPSTPAGDDRYAAVRQYSLAQTMGVWAAAAVPMGVLAWIVTPLVSHHLSGPEPLGRALMVCLTVGLVWQFVLVMILMRHELGTLQWSRLRDALWLRSPREPNTGHVGGKVWWWAGVWVFLGALWALVPKGHGPMPRDFGVFLSSHRGQTFFHGAWGWYALVLVWCVLNTVIGEELLFRGVLLPRMREVFGRRDWIANGVLFGLYHLHQPWGMPGSVVEGVLLEAYPTRRFQSAWMGIIVHSLETVFVAVIVLALVIK